MVGGNRAGSWPRCLVPITPRYSRLPALEPSALVPLQLLKENSVEDRCRGAAAACAQKDGQPSCAIVCEARSESQPHRAKVLKSGFQI